MARLLDPKVRNLMIFLVTRGGSVAAFLYFVLKYSGETDPVKLVGWLTIAVLSWRMSLSMYRRLIQAPKDPLAYGKWGIVTGSTAGIGKEYAEELARKGMNVLLISRDEKKLKGQVQELSEAYKVNCKYLIYDFSAMVPSNFYQELKKTCALIDKDGGIGMLINNVGFNEDRPLPLEEFTDEAVDAMLHCNIHSTVGMTRAILPLMKNRGKGCVLSVSSISGNHPGPFIQLYSATKAFITQFSRSMHVECWDSGVDFLVVTPSYVVSNLYKRKTGTILAPMPSALVQGSFAQLGKKYVWQGHGYWFHGVLGGLATYYWGTTARYRKMMVDNRARYDEKMAAKQKEN